MRSRCPGSRAARPYSSRRLLVLAAPFGRIAELQGLALFAAACICDRGRRRRAAHYDCVDTVAIVAAPDADIAEHEPAVELLGARVARTHLQVDVVDTPRVGLAEQLGQQRGGDPAA